jgi:hypothetical protein
MAKLLASEATWHATEATFATFGGFAFAREYDICQGIRHRAQMARGPSLPDRADLDQPDPRLSRPARLGDAAVVLSAAAAIRRTGRFDAEQEGIRTPQTRYRHVC